MTQNVITLVAGIDSSTQACKVIIKDAESGRTVRTGRAGHPEGSSVDPNAWWSALALAMEGPSSPKSASSPAPPLTP